MATRDPYLLVEELLLAADHDVATEVGAEPGTVVRTARPREGLVRAKIAWVVWSAWPAALEEALAALEKLRANAGADRAIGMVDGDPPEGQSGAVKRGPLDVMTVRRFAFELADVEAHLGEVRARFVDSLGDSFLPLPVETGDGQIRDGVTTVIEWSQTASPDDVLWIGGPFSSGRTTLVTAAAARIAEQFSGAPDRIRPLLAHHGSRRSALLELLRARGWVMLDKDDTEHDPFHTDRHPSSGIHSTYWPHLHELPKVRQRHSGLRVLPLASSVVLDSMERHIPRRGAAVRRLASILPDFEALLVRPTSLGKWMTVLEAHWPDGAMSDAETVARLVVSMLADLSLESDDYAPRVALEHFSVGRTDSHLRGRASMLDDVESVLGWPALNGHHFENLLVRDYFVARQIIADVRAGRRDILTRHQFPREFVLLFLAILSPEVAALASEGRAGAMRDEIAAEVEREVQLALAHNLKTPIAMIRGALSDARKKLSTVERERLTDELASIEGATRYIAALVEKTGQLTQVPEETPIPLMLARIVEHALTPLRHEWPDMQVSVEIDEAFRVRAGPGALQTILSNLLENAFHAAASNSLALRVTVRARRTEDTLRLEVIDTGPGVHPDDRERIFRPHFTLKKGGRGKPRGTGLGLPIARSWAEHIGGKLWLDAAASQTTFVLELVPARETKDDH